MAVGESGQALMSGLATDCPIRTRSSGMPAASSRSAKPPTIASGPALCLAGPISQSTMVLRSFELCFV